jgi:ubiquinone/menaquinone biosynthesis C-methylase UbiE
VDLALENIQVGNRILDIGCGTGELTHELYKRAPPQGCVVVGMDADSNMIQRANEQFVNDETKKDLQFIVGDACQFKLSEPLFDVIFSNAALHWVGTHGASRAADCMSKALADNGCFVLEFGGKGNVKTIVNAILEVMDLPKQAADFWWYPSIGELASLMEQHNMEVTQAQLFDRPTELKGEDGLKIWLKMFANKFFEGLGENQVESAMDRVVELCRPTLYYEGVWKADYRRIRVVGRKVER